MTTKRSDEEVEQLMKRAKDISIDMLRNVKSNDGLDVSYACMKIITFVASQQITDREAAYQFMADLFAIGDELLKDYDASGATAWSKE